MRPSGSIRGSIPLDSRASEPDILAATLPEARRAEREREAELIDHIEDGIGPGGGAVHGAVETLTALQAGQVMTLAINNDYSVAGWADYTFPMYSVGSSPAAHPGGGDPANLVPVALPEELVRLALQSSAGIEIIKRAVDTATLNDAEPVPGASDPHRGRRRHAASRTWVASAPSFVTPSARISRRPSGSCDQSQSAFAFTAVCRSVAQQWQRLVLSPGRTS